jgi:hypothetical protein
MNSRISQSQQVMVDLGVLLLSSNSQPFSYIAFVSGDQTPKILFPTSYLQLPTEVFKRNIAAHAELWAHDRMMQRAE